MFQNIKNKVPKIWFCKPTGSCFWPVLTRVQVVGEQLSRAGSWYICKHWFPAAVCRRSVPFSNADSIAPLLPGQSPRWPSSPQAPKILQLPSFLRSEVLGRAELSPGWISRSLYISSMLLIPCNPSPALSVCLAASGMQTKVTYWGSNGLA